MDPISYPGPYCEALAITEDALLGADELPVLSQVEDLTKGVVYELNLFRQKHDISWKQFEEWLMKLVCKHTVEFPSLKTLTVSVMRVMEERSKLKRNKKPLDLFFSTTYMIPQSVEIVPAKPRRVVKSMLPDSDALLQVNTELEEELHQTQKLLKLQKQEAEFTATKATELQTKATNIKKKLRRRDEALEKKSTEVVRLKGDVSSNFYQLQKTAEKLVKAQKSRELYRSRANYAKIQVQKSTLETAEREKQFDELLGAFSTHVKELEAVVTKQKDIIDQLQFENEHLQEEIDRLEKKRLVTFEHGKYSDGVRQCCLELLSMNVGVKNVDPIIRTVLSNIAGITVDRLPKYTTIVEMLPEMKALAYKQIAEKLQVSQQLTLHSDGTSKFGQHYGSFQVSTTQSSYSLGLSEMLCGSAQCTLDTLKLILSEIDVVAGEGSGSTILVNIKNTMSDRHIVEKSFNELLESYRSEVLPSMVEGWSDLSHDEQARISNLNNFFCGLHLLVGMADASAAVLLQWEEANSDMPLGAAARPGHFERKEAGISDY